MRPLRRSCGRRRRGRPRRGGGPHGRRPGPASAARRLVDLAGRVVHRDRPAVERQRHEHRVLVHCASLVLRGQLISGTDVPGPVIGDFDSALVTSCTGPLGITFSLTFQGFPWSISATGYTAANDTVLGTISGVGVHLSALGCSVDLGGPSGAAATLDFAYANPTHQLTITGGDGGSPMCRAPASACSTTVTRRTSTVSSTSSRPSSSARPARRPPRTPADPFGGRLLSPATNGARDRLSDHSSDDKIPLPACHRMTRKSRREKPLDALVFDHLSRLITRT